MKKFFVFAILVALCFNFMSCRNRDATGAASGERPLRVLLISNLQGDRSFADSAIEGAIRAEWDFNIELSFSQSDDPADYENMILIGAENFDLVVAGASQWQSAIERHAPNYPNVMFGITDTNAEGDNVVSVTFAQNQGSFLAGAAAAMFTEMTQFPGVNQEATIGWVGGVDIPALRDFFIGYTEGARYINPDIRILQSFAGAWNDPLRGMELTLAMYEQGADIVMNVASGTGNGVLQAARDAGRYAIGVDMNQDGDQPGAILTSMLKENGQGVYHIIRTAVEEGRFTGNQRLYMDLEFGGVDLTDMATFKSVHNTAEQRALIDSIIARIEVIKQDIATGRIVVTNYPGYGRDAR